LRHSFLILIREHLPLPELDVSWVGEVVLAEGFVVFVPGAEDGVDGPVDGGGTELVDPGEDEGTELVDAGDEGGTELVDAGDVGGTGLSDTGDGEGGS